MAPNLIQAQGGQPQKPTRFVSLFTSRFLSGLFTNRSPLRGPLQAMYSDYYHLGATDALIDGLNSELSIRQTMIRRPGNVAFSSGTTAGAVDNFYSFHKADGTITVIADSTVDVETVTPGLITSIFTKATGAGQGYFQGINKSLYIADGIDAVKYIPGTLNPDTGKPVWNMSGVAPTVAPTLTTTITGSAGVSWIASTVFSTMGFIFDSGTGTIQQLYTINADGSNSSPTPANTGKSGTGVPNWNQGYLQTTTDGSVTWTNFGQILLWQPNHNYAGGDPIYDPGTKCVFITSHNYNVTSGSVYPSFTSTLGISGARVTESTGARWENIGQVNGGPSSLPTCIKSWKASTVFNKYDPPVNGTGGGDPTNVNCATIEPSLVLPSTAANPVFLLGATTNGTTGTASVPKWGTTAGALTSDGQLGYVCLGNSTTTSATWQAGTPYSGWTPGGIFSALKDANANFQVCIGTGASGAIVPGTAATLTAASNASGGNTTYTGTFVSPFFTAGYPVTITGFAASSGINNGKFKVVSCNATTLVATNPNGVAETHAGTATFNPWGTTYGAQITDGTVTWTCVGAASPSWAATTQWYLPASGFVPPSASQQYGSASVVDSNTNNEFVISSGLSGGSAPSWNGIGSTTTDSGITWYNVSAFTSAGYAWTKGHGYCYAFKARATTDIFTNTAPPLQLPSTNSPNTLGPLGAPYGCGDGTVTTASPVTQTVGGNTGAQVKITGPGSTDPQFDTVVIFRSADGFQASGPFLFLTEINMPPRTANGGPGTWNVIDFMPAQASSVTVAGVTTVLHGLDQTTSAPIANVNDPVPGSYGSTQFVPSAGNLTTPAAGTGLIGLVYHQGRLWGHIGNNVFASGGPDTDPGNGFTNAWPPNQVFPFDSTVIRLIPTATALLVFTTTAVYLIVGGPDITTYYSQLLAPGVGLLSWNAVTMVLGLPYLFSSDRQFITIDPSGGFTRIGHPIGDKLSAFNPALAHVAYPSFGDAEHALFISDGSKQSLQSRLLLARANF